jgi:two-component system NtrC family sensor kinase
MGSIRPNERTENASRVHWMETQERESLEAELQGLQERVRELERLASVGELTGTVTHEFNNLLMTILNYARMGMRYPDTATRDQAFQKIVAASEKAARLTTVVLGLARPGTGEMEPLKLHPLLEDSLLLMEREFQKFRISLERQIEAVPEILGDASQLQRVLINLLTNARQAIIDGGEVQVTLQHHPASNTVQCTVRDSGCGMTSAQMRRMFDPFFTTKKGPDSTGKGGVGLGLAECKKILEKHQAKIRVESAPGKGTSISIRFPTLAANNQNLPDRQAS